MAWQKLKKTTRLSLEAKRVWKETATKSLRTLSSVLNQQHKLVGQMLLTNVK